MQREVSGREERGREKLWVGGGGEVNERDEGGGGGCGAVRLTK